MDSFEFNKIAGAVLAALLVIVSLNVFYDPGASDGHAAGGAHAAAGFMLPAAVNAVTPAGSNGAATAPAAGSAPAVPTAGNGAGGGDAALALLAVANPAKGAKVFKKCKACHKTNKGGPNSVGPNLWGIIGREKGTADGFKYSKAMLNKGGSWTYGDLVSFLRKPKAFLPGTKMSYGGLKKAKDLADLTAYLRSLADNPVPLP